jgi:hypothetical protein
MAWRRASALAIAALAAVLGACGGTEVDAVDPPPFVGPAPVPERPLAFKAELRGDAIAHAIREAARAEARRKAALRRLRRSRTVEGALRRALLARKLSPAQHAKLRAQWATARGAVGRLSGVRRGELAAVVGTTERLAAARALQSSRLPAVFLILRRNTEFWTRAPLPASGWRTTFGRDPAVFQYYPGRGMQLQPLASWGRVNAVAGVCLKSRGEARRRDPCPSAALRRSLDGLLALAADRGGFLAWEHYFAYGSGRPPWISGMTQATAVQALARAGRAFDEPRYTRAAAGALGAFEHAPPLGVRVPATGGSHYLMYSFSPGLRIFNGHLQAVTGLADMARLGRSRRARRLFRSGERAARRTVAGFDTGAWSLYSAAGKEATLGYHELIRGFLGNLCQRTRARTYCAAQKRFARYEHEPTRIGIGPLRGVRARRSVPLRFSLSKVSSVKIRVWGARGMSLSRDLSLPYGHHRLAWTPPARGTYRVRVEAQGPSGPRAVELRTVRVVLPRPPKKKHKKKRRAEQGIDRRSSILRPAE